MEVSDLYVCSYSMNRSLYRQVGHGRGHFLGKHSPSEIANCRKIWIFQCNIFLMRIFVETLLIAKNLKFDYNSITKNDSMILFEILKMETHEKLTEYILVFDR